MIYQKKGFTLVELMIVITIMVMMMSLSYVPYSYLQNKTKLKISSSEISQSLSFGRDLAISGLETGENTGSGNKSIGVFFNNKNGENGKIYFYAYPYDTKTGSLNIPDSGSNLFKTRDLQDGILINGTESKLFFFEAITGNVTILGFNSGTKKVLTGSVEVDFSYKNSKKATLNQSIIYDTQTNIVNLKLGS